MRKALKYLNTNLHLIKQLTRRDILQRYQGSYLGIIWSFITPMIMLAIYTYFFGFVFKTKWGATTSDSNLEFALILFCGLIVFNFFSEVITKSPVLIINNANLVKKVVFPLETLPIVTLLSALVHMLISMIVLLILLLIKGIFNWTILFFPVVLLPILLFTLGFSWILSSLGVFIRDISQIVGLAVQALMFLSPIFYPISVIPEYLRFIYYFNPITYVVEDMRKILIWGQTPDWKFTIIGTVLGIIVMYIGSKWFRKTKGGFADVL